MKKVRTRFAPSPTGFMHIGGVRTALYAYLIAKQNNGDFILRIEDTDQERYIEGTVDVIYNTLKDLGLNWDEGPDVGGPFGPYIQSERKGRYLDYAKKLVREGKAYYCFCSEEELEEQKKVAEISKISYKYNRCCRELALEEAENRVANGEEHVIRFKMPKEGTTDFEDLVYGKIVVDNNELEDLIMVKSDGMPTYNFANIIDDYEMEISHIIRGCEYISSTPKYVLMYQALGFDVPAFVHLPIIKKNKDSDKKLSKRDGDATVEMLKSKGYLNEAIINMLALTGWSPGNEQEIFSLEELVKLFDINKIGKGNAIFDIDKLNWINSHYIKQLPIDELYKLTIPYLEKEYDLSNKNNKWLKELISLYQNEISYGAEIVEVSSLFFKDKELSIEAKEFMKQDGVKEVIEAFKKKIINIDGWNPDSIKAIINDVKEEIGIKGQMLYMPIRIAVSGQMHGPELPKTIYLFGKNEVLKRLQGEI